MSEKTEVKSIRNNPIDSTKVDVKGGMQFQIRTIKPVSIIMPKVKTRKFTVKLEEIQETE
jgi:hypothetical protein